eukprot:Lithocolla_globosa_v1_NODE_3705_length_1602_cov_4.678733.p2 type:complete len:214 gc:universal NODE_3705_length_1602_cov_4.678733:885-1526(+)
MYPWCFSGLCLGSGSQCRLLISRVCHFTKSLYYFVHLIGVLLPLLTLGMLHYGEKKELLYQPSILGRFGSLYGAFIPKYVTFGVLLQVRKIVFLLLFIFLRDQPVVQFTCITVFFSTFALLSINLQPYKVPSLVALDIMTMNLLIVLLQSVWYGVTEHPFTSSFLVYGWPAIAIFVLIFIWTYWKENRSPEEKINQQSSIEMKEMENTIVISS